MQIKKTKHKRIILTIVLAQLKKINYCKRGIAIKIKILLVYSKFAEKKKSTKYEFYFPFIRLNYKKMIMINLGLWIHFQF